MNLTQTGETKAEAARRHRYEIIKRECDLIKAAKEIPAVIDTTTPPRRPALIYRSQFVQTSPLKAQETTSAIVEISSEPEDKGHHEAPSNIPVGVGSPIPNSDDAVRGESVQNGVTPTPAGSPRCVVVVLLDDDDDDELDRLIPLSYPVEVVVAETSPSQPYWGSQDSSPQPYWSSQSSSPQPPPPGQPPRKYTSPSPSSDYLPIPGAFPRTPSPVKTPSLDENTYAGDYLDGYVSDPDSDGPWGEDSWVE